MLKPDRKTELIRLVKKVINGKASAAEERFVEKYYDYFEKNKYDPAGLSPVEKEELENKILQQIDLRKSGSEEKGTTLFLNKKLYKYVAAAAVLVVIVGLYFFYNYSTVSQRSVAGNDGHSPANTDVAPGGNKAVLTLANGSMIVLDSVHQGTLAMQGNNRVMKVDRGMIAYHQLAAGSGQPAGEKRQPEVQFNTLTTPRGGEYQLELSDGTKVWLNSASSLKFPTAFEGKERKVILTGEAYFEVVKDKDQPFKVQVGGMEVEDLGTHFNVMAYSDEPDIKTTLLEGAVKVINGNATATLQPGQQAIITHDSDKDIRVVETDTAEAVSWKNGVFAFHSTNIYEIMKQLSRWYNVDVSYHDSLHVFLNGEISRNVKVSEVFKMLELTGELSFTIDGKKIIVRKGY
jgi:ferric-dicitrate binding protein FerR (iron transport regulator)